MTVAVIDTNVVVSGVLTGSPQSPTRIILDAMLAGRMRFALSVDLLAEYREALLRPAIARRHGLDAGLIDKLLARLAVGAMLHGPPAVATAIAAGTGTVTADTAIAVATPAGTAPVLVRDPGDAHVALLASSLPNVVVVTGDRRLREDLAPACSVMSPAEYVSRRA